MSRDDDATEFGDPLSRASRARGRDLRRSAPRYLDAAPPLAIDTIRARRRSRRSLFIEGAKPSSSARSSPVKTIGIAAGTLFMRR